MCSIAFTEACQQSLSKLDKSNQHPLTLFPYCFSVSKNHIVLARVGSRSNNSHFLPKENKCSQIFTDLFVFVQMYYFDIILMRDFVSPKCQSGSGEGGRN